jgi:hypothetical protein
MATGDAAHGQPPPTHGAKTPYGLLTIRRTARVIATCRRHPWRYQPSVHPDHRYEYPPHASLLRISSHRPSSSSNNTRPRNSPTPGRQSTTTSTPCKSDSRSRACSRIRRRNLFLVTALPTRFGIVTPSRRGSPGRTKYRRPIPALRNDLPRRYTAWKAAAWHSERTGARVHTIPTRLHRQRVTRPDYTVTRLRPFARRRFTTRRPPGVAIRERNPWVVLRLRRFGW